MINMTVNNTKPLELLVAEFKKHKSKEDEGKAQRLDVEKKIIEHLKENCEEFSEEVADTYRYRGEHTLEITVKAESEIDDAPGFINALPEEVGTIIRTKYEYSKSVHNTFIKQFGENSSLMKKVAKIVAKFVSWDVSKPSFKVS